MSIPHIYECWGESKTAEDWAADPRCMVSVQTLRDRITRNWSVHRALTTKPMTMRNSPPPVDVPIKPHVTPARSYGNHAMPPGSLRINRPAPARAGADDNQQFKSLTWGYS